jgi:diguanylate cyclase (GGDEF)-like protein
MRGAIRIYDELGRYGGEEFMMVLPRCEMVDAVSVAERVRLEVAAMPVNTLLVPLSITLSVGVCAAHPGQTTDCDQLLRLADAALYRAKQNGRNRVEAATDCENKCLPAARKTEAMV